MKIKTNELDCIYLSYDEPNKEKHWAILQDIAPWSKRVDGVKGFDTAHKACAAQSDTEYLITVDGDNQVFPEFFDLELDVPPSYVNCVLSWNAVNTINGMSYGNGGVKIWPKRFIENMRSHENSVDPTHAVDFCWDKSYVQLNNIYSSTHPNGSALQAFRAGFREGCKMTLDAGITVDNAEQVLGKMFSLNVARLRIWGSVGADCDYGKWAMVGTRLGAYYTNVEKRDITLVCDYDDLTTYANAYLQMESNQLTKLIDEITNELSSKLGLTFVSLDSAQSQFFKSCMPRHPKYPNPLVTESYALGS